MLGPCAILIERTMLDHLEVDISATDDGRNVKRIPMTIAQESKPSSKEEKEEKENTTTSTAPVATAIKEKDKDEDEDVLEAFGDISLTNIDFVPPPPSTISPRKNAQRDAKSLLLPEEKKFGNSRAEIATPSLRSTRSTQRLRPQSVSRARREAADMSFDSMVDSLKQSREAENTGASLSRPASRGKSLTPEVRIHAPEPKRLITLLRDFGNEVGLFGGKSHESDENSAQSAKSLGDSSRCDENVASEGASIPRPKNAGPLRRGAKIPQRLPIPRWEVDDTWCRADERATSLHLAAGWGGITPYR